MNAAGSVAGSTTMRDIGDELFKRLVEMRRWFHQHPDLAFEEADTAQRIIGELERLEIPCDYAGVGHSVIGHIAGVDPGMRAIALRAEMDGLPGNETTGATYESVKPGKMHACGHDAHMTMVLGAAELLRNDPPPGPVQLIFQPAEEKGGGARRAIADGALQNVIAIFAGHVTHEYHTGQVMVRDGIVTAQSDRFLIRIRGRGGHGARPHEAVDAVVISGFLITALQTLVSRETNPFHPTVVTIGKIHAGSAANVIAEEAQLEGSIRTSNTEVRHHVLHGIERMIRAAAELHNAEITVDFSAGYPPVVNDSGAAAIARKAAGQVVGADNVVGSEYPSMGSEDFSFYLDHVPGAFVRIGARNLKWEPVPLHSPAFDIDENALAIGTRYFDQVVRTAHVELGGGRHGL